MARRGTSRSEWRDGYGFLWARVIRGMRPSDSRVHARACKRRMSSVRQPGPQGHSPRAGGNQNKGCAEAIRRSGEGRRSTRDLGALGSLHSRATTQKVHSLAPSAFVDAATWPCAESNRASLTRAEGSITPRNRSGQRRPCRCCVRSVSHGRNHPGERGPERRPVAFAGERPGRAFASAFAGLMLGLVRGSMGTAPGSQTSAGSLWSSSSCCASSAGGCVRGTSGNGEPHG